MVDSPIGTFWYYCVVCIDFMATHELINGVTILDFLIIGLAFEYLTWIIGQVITGMSGPEVGDDDEMFDIMMRNSSDYQEHAIFTNVGKRGKYGRYIDF